MINEFSNSHMYLDAFGAGTSNIDVYSNYFHDFNGCAIFIGSEKAPSSVTGINIYNNLFYNNANGCLVVYGKLVALRQ